MRVVDTIFKARDDAALIEVLSEIPGGADLLAWFGGYLPSFHDAEILGLELDRAGATCRIRAHTWEISDEVDKTGHFVLSRHVVAWFELWRRDRVEPGGLQPSERDFWSFHRALGQWIPHRA